MSSIGYTRESKEDWEVRIVKNKITALYHLYYKRWKVRLPAEFFEWLNKGKPGDTYWLTTGIQNPELWIFPLKRKD